MYVTETTGNQILDYLTSQLRPMDSWSTREGNMLSWFPYTLRQDIWFDDPVEDGGLEVTRVHAETVLLDGVRVDAGIRQEANELNRYASLSRLLVDDEEEDICLYCSAYFHEQNLPWMREFFVHVAALQALQAQRFVEGKLPKKWGGEPAVRPGPSGIVRFAPEPALAAVQQACTGADDQPSPWTEEEFEAVVGTAQRPWVLASAGPDGMTAEFPFTGTTSSTEAMLRGGGSRDVSFPGYRGGAAPMVGKRSACAADDPAPRGRRRAPARPSGVAELERNRRLVPVPCPRLVVQRPSGTDVRNLRPGIRVQA